MPPAASLLPTKGFFLCVFFWRLEVLHGAALFEGQVEATGLVLHVHITSQYFMLVEVLGAGGRGNKCAGLLLLQPRQEEFRGFRLRVAFWF